MTKRIIFCLTMILLCTISGLSQSRQKSVKRSNVKTLDGIVIGTEGGPSWIGIVVKSGGKEYVVSINNSDYPKSDPQTTGNVEVVGTKVRITYIQIKAWDNFRQMLSATRVAVINESSNTKPIILNDKNTTKISEKDLREQLIRDGLNNELKGCEGLSVSISPTNIDLNKDGQAEIIATVDSACWGARGRKVWIYQKTNGKLKTLLTNIDGSLEANNTSTRGFRDITLVSGGYIDVYKYTYKYNGNKYQYFVGKRYQRNQSGNLVLQEVLNR